jgi:peptidoglycan/xylan/chitin deacetylase (PgdA/CDA1 family)
VIHPDTLILMYHYVRPPDAPVRVGAGSVGLDTFAHQLDTLVRTRTPLRWRDVHDAVVDGRPTPPDGFLLTFDDGHDDHHRYVLPMLVERGLEGTFFVMARDADEGLTVGHRIHVLLGALSVDELRARVVERLPAPHRAAFAATRSLDDLKWVLQRERSVRVGPILSALIRDRVGDERDLARGLHLEPSQLIDLVDAGMVLGGHSHSHPWLDWLPPDEVARELQASRQQLTALCRGGPFAFAYPYGAPPRNAGRLLPRHGFAAGFVASGNGRMNRYRLGRVDAEGSWA